MARTLVRVTKEHIERGRKRNCHDCPIALAVANATKNKYVTVLLHSVSVPMTAHTVQCFFLPRSAQRFIKRFDSGKTVEPFNFYLESEK